MSKEKPLAVPTAAMEVDELPRTIVRRVVKEKLSDLSGDGADFNLHKEALLAFSESARIFIHYLSATAHDICTESRRQIINAEDVLKALEEIEFSEFVEPLREALDEFKKKAAGKRAGAAKAKEVIKKRKADEDAAKQNSKDAAEQVVGENGEDEEEANGDKGDEGEEQPNGDDEDEGEEQANGDDEDEVAEKANGDNEDEVEAEEQTSEDDSEDSGV